MTDGQSNKHSNEEFSFGSLASSFADEPTPKKESAGPAKITRANVTASAPAVDAAVPAVEPASAPALPPMPNAPMPALPEVQNPAQTPGFWGSALASSLPNLLAAGLGGAGLAAYGLSKRGQSGGQGLQAPSAVDEDVRQLRLAQEQAKLEAMYAKEARQQQLHEANLAKMQPAAQPAAATVQAASTGLPSTSQQFSVTGQPQPTIQYGQQKTNAPVGVPSPVGQAAPVEPPPMSDLERIRLEKAQVDLENARAKAIRDQQLHDKKIADMEARTVKKDAEKLSSLQGQSAAEVNMRKSSIRAEEGKSAEAAIKAAVKTYPPIKTEPTVSGAAEPTLTSTTEKQPVIPSAAAVEESKKRRSSAEVAAENASKPYKSFRNAMVTNLGGNDHPEAAKKALSVLKEKVFGGEIVGLEKGKSHPGENWTKAKEYILANPSQFEKPVVDYIQKGAEKARAEASAKKAAQLAAGALASGGGGGAGPVIRGGGGGSTGIGRAGEEIHNLNPLKL